MKTSSIGTKLLLLAITLGVLGYFGVQGLQYFSDPLTTTIAYAYQVEDGMDLSGYVVRQEQVLPDEEGGLLRLQRAEGERVSVNGTVAVIYQDQASLDRQKELDELSGRIEQLEFAQEASVGAEVSLKLDAQIMQSLLDHKAAVAAGRLDKAESHQLELRSLVLKRDYTYTNSGDLTTELEALKAREKELKAQTSTSTRRVTSPVSGIYSAVVDGYETALTYEALTAMKPTDLANLKADGTVSSRVGKLILGDAWYYAASMNVDDIKELQKMDALILRFAKGVEQDLDVTVDFVGEEENGRAVVVFRSEEYLPQLTLLRQQSAQLIHGTIDGIRIPKAALRASGAYLDETGQRVTTESLGVYCVVGMEARFKPVEVLHSGDSFVLVRSTAASNQESIRLRHGDEVIIAAGDLYDGKVVGQYVK